MEQKSEPGAALTELTGAALERYLLDYLQQYVAREAWPHSAHEAAVLLVHAILARLGFKLVALGETGPLIQEKKLPEEWNASREAWAFRYRHSQSSLTYVVKAVSLGDQLLVHAVALELAASHPPASLQLAVPDFVRSTARFPASSSDDIHVDWSSLYVRDALARLVQSVERDIYRHLMPDVKDLANASPASTGGSRVPSRPQSEEPRRDDRDDDPLRVRPPRRPHPFESDPLRAGPPGGLYGPGGFGVGRGDLFGPGHPAYPPGRGGGWDEGAGNLVGPRHPGFGPLVRDPYAPLPSFPDQGRGGPPFARPPGARFDPFGPPGVNRPWPDHDELPPPGPPSSGAWEDMFM